jgi:hypothetical protein
MSPVSWGDIFRVALKRVTELMELRQPVAWLVEAIWIAPFILEWFLLYDSVLQGEDNAVLEDNRYSSFSFWFDWL